MIIVLSNPRCLAGTSTSTIAAKAHPVVSDSGESDDEVEIIEQWNQRLKSTQQYKIAVILLTSRKQDVPSQEKMIDYLLAFADLSTEHCFPLEGSKQLNEFNKLQAQIQLDVTKTARGQKKKWTKSFCAKKIAMLIILHHELRAMQERNTRSHSFKKMTPLCHNFMTLAEIWLSSKLRRTSAAIPPIP